MPSCPECGGQVADASSYCAFCGARLVRLPPAAPSCPGCGTRNLPGNSFCHACGHGLSPPAPGRSTPGPRVTAPGSASSVAGAHLVTVRRDGSDGEVFALPRDQMDIGRTEGDLRFEDPHLGPRHARIVRRGGQYVLVPLETRNGVYNRLFQATDVLDGDQILIGKQVLKFELLSDVEKTLRPAIEHGVLLFGTPVRAPWGRLRQLTSAGTFRDVYHLSRPEVIMGREQGDIVFSDDEFLSRRHAALQFRGGRVTLTDLGSSNGTYLRLRAQHVLVPGEMIRMGDELLRFELG